MIFPILFHHARKQTRFSIKIVTDRSYIYICFAISCTDIEFISFFSNNEKVAFIIFSLIPSSIYLPLPIR